MVHLTMATGLLLESMNLHWTDWSIIAAYLALSLGIGLYYRKRAGRNMSEFFLGGRSLSWFLAGISMVATTFAADTPLAVNELVAKNGIAGNWLWWSFLLGGMLTTFFFSGLWRRAEILTEAELVEFRYGGTPAAWLRGFKAVYLGLFINCLIIGWVNLALVSILQVFFGISEQTALWYVGGAMLITSVYSAISGLMGVAVTDAVQFLIAMAGCIVLAVLVVESPRIGGLDGLKSKLPEGSLDFFPKIGNENVLGTLSISLGAFLAYTTVMWWSSWYPGAEPGGGGYVAQRMMSAKDEKNSILATLLFQVAHYCIRPWPWILVGLCSIILYPDLAEDEKRLGYVLAMKEFLPAGLKGLLLVAFLAAYMSTISTQLNWGASYLVNDLYRRFIRPDVSDEKHYVNVARFITIACMLVSLFVTSRIASISGVWGFIIECGAGLGAVLILRWYWWRINAYAEIAATLSPFVYFGIARYSGLVFPESYFFTVGLTTVTWLTVMWLTPAEDTQHLQKFYDRVRPGGWWKPFSGDAPKGHSGWLITAWLSATVGTYSILFATGYFLFSNWELLAICVFIAFASFGILLKALNKVSVL